MIPSLDRLAMGHAVKKIGGLLALQTEGTIPGTCWAEDYYEHVIRHVCINQNGAGPMQALDPGMPVETAGKPLLCWPSSASTGTFLGGERVFPQLGQAREGVELGLGQ